MRKTIRPGGNANAGAATAISASTLRWIERQLTSPLAGVPDGSWRGGLVDVLCVCIYNRATASGVAGATSYCGRPLSPCMSYESGN
ncbi:MAG TPA: hypothetical protein VGK24_19185 [Candidatus Angelobacter sp.]